MKITELKELRGNPRQINEKDFEKLKKSIKDFEIMLSIRKIIIDENNEILGGNMRFKALKALGYTDIKDEWIDKREDLTPEQKKEFIIKDNLQVGEFDFDLLANEWDQEDLGDWGLDIKVFEDEDIDFDDIKSTEDREKEFKLQTVTCPHKNKYATSLYGIKKKIGR